MPASSSSTPQRKSKKLQASSGSWRARSATLRQSATVTVTVSKPKEISGLITSSPNWPTRWSRSASASIQGHSSAGDPGLRLGPDHDRLQLVARVALLEGLGADALLQLDDAVQERLGPGRAAGDVDVHRDDLVDAFGDRVGVPVRPAAVGTGAERDHVLRLRHLVVEPLQGGGHLVGEGARHHQQVGLARAVGEGDHPEADEVVAGHGGGDELDGAACEAEVEHPQRVLAAPVEDKLDGLWQLDGVD